MKSEKSEKIEVYEHIVEFPNQIRNAYYFQDVLKYKGKFNRIVIFGMGGSYIVGLLFKEFVKDELRIPVEVYSGELPLIDDETLVVLISYSGNTKEILSVFNKVKKNKVLVITSGGKILQRTIKNKKLLIQIPPGLHQRFTFSYGFFPLLKFFENNFLIDSKSKVVEKIIKTLKKNRRAIEEEAKQFALKSKNKTLLFYASNYFYPAAYRLQTSIEEDAKIICHANKITELFHNELEAFPNNKSFCLLLIDDKETKKFKKQINYFKKLINFCEVKHKRYSKEERMFLIFYLVDFFGYYLSKLKHTKMGETLKSDWIKRL